MITLSTLKLAAKRKKYYSQAGEDGLLDYIMSQLPNCDQWCVEFGAWDGKHLSNCYFLIQQRNYKSVLIEMNDERYSQLVDNMAQNSSICINEQVGFLGDKTLDQILKATPIPANFDLLSIDIDGNDYFVWQTLQTYSPKVVIIEINSHFSPGTLKINDPSNNFELAVSGSSISALTRLGESKGYSLISVVGCNAIFVRKEYFFLFHKKEINEFDMFSYEAFSYQELGFSAQLQQFLLWLAKPRLFSRVYSAVKRQLL